jgi:uroporphyrinogen III methyltransferase/synthase
MRLRIGTRNSKLALIQAENAAERLRALLPGFSFDIVPLSSPGDRDRETDLRESPGDFFTRDLDQALLDGELDLAVHSAKDVPYPAPAGLDWFWLPWREDARDVLVAASGRQVGDFPDNPRIGVSSERREVYCRKRFPTAPLLPIRGNIDDRLRQLDEARFDLVVMAAAALQRLGLTHRITEWISLDDLPTPAGQGALAITFRANDACLLRLRSLFVKTVTFVGAGVGSADLCTLAGTKALNRCEVCLHDALLDPALLDHLPADAARIDVGKRSGAHSREQPEINALLARYARRGLRVVRLKGGDPGIFGRLAEEIESLDALRLPYRVIPGVGSLSAATTGTGMLLTRRGVSRGFSVLSARAKGGKIADVSAPARAALPCVFFMGTGVVDDLRAQLLADGIPADTPAAIVYNAGADNETILRAPLAEIPTQARQAADYLPPITCHLTPSTTTSPPPGLLIVGEIARYAFNRDHGALQGKRVLLTCSDALLDRAVEAVHDLGGRPICFPLVRIRPARDAGKAMVNLARYDWLVLTSPSARPPSRSMCPTRISTSTNV